MLFLNSKDVEGLVSMEEAMAAVEKVFLAHARGKTAYPPKSQFMLPTGWKWWGFMPAYVEGMGVACKIVCDYPDNKKIGKPTIMATIVLCDTDTGEVKAVIDGTKLTAIRTGALCALAADRLARKDAQTVGIIGCGAQARTQLEGLTKVRKIKRVRVYDVNGSAMDAFIKDMKKLGVTMEKSTADGVLDSDIVVAATVTKKPVVFYKELKPGTHVTSIGAHTPGARELDEEFMKKAKVVVDMKDVMNSGDMKGYKGVLTEIQDVLAGKRVRANDSEITLFKSTGTALQDVAMASLVYEKAMKRGLGSKIDF